MINRLLSKSRVAEVAAVTMQLIDVYKKGDWSTDDHLIGIYTILEQQFTELKRAIRHTTAEFNLEDADELRDDKTYAVYHLAQGLLHYPEPKVKAAAQAVNLVLNKYGFGNEGNTFPKEFSHTASLMNDLETPSLIYNIKALPGMPVLVHELEKAQQAFEHAHEAYQKEIAKEGSRNNAVQIKKQVLNTINKKLLVYLRAMVQVNESRYAGLVGTVAQFIEVNNKSVKQRCAEKA